MKYEYMKESEQMLQYFQFPKFLLKLRISQTAKFKSNKYHEVNYCYGKERVCDERRRYRMCRQ